MQAIRNILAVLEPNKSEGLAVGRAKRLAKVLQCGIHLLICDKNPKYRQQLEEAVEALHKEGFYSSGEQEWNESIHQTIITVQRRHGCDLVIKEHTSDSALKRAILTPEDWKLLRFCPCPVVIVKNDLRWAGGNVLAAIDVGNRESQHRVLRSSIVDYGNEVTGLIEGSLHVITAYPSPMLSAADPGLQLQDTVAARYREQCKPYQDKYKIPEEHMHICEGPADVLIPQVAKEIKAVICVLGTVARTGLTGALIGNTAESVLDALDCDILVLKPTEAVDELERVLETH